MLPLFFSPHPCFRASTSTYPRMNICVFADEHLLCRFFMFPAPCSGVQLGKYSHVSLHFSLLIIKRRNEDLQKPVQKFEVGFEDLHLLHLILKGRNVNLHFFFLLSKVRNVCVHFFFLIIKVRNE